MGMEEVMRSLVEMMKGTVATKRGKHMRMLAA
jgi:hypothetical protein